MLIISVASLLVSINTPGSHLPVFCIYQYNSSNLCVLVFVLSSGESEPGDRQCVGGGGRDGDHQLSGEEQ